MSCIFLVGSKFKLWWLCELCVTTASTCQLLCTWLNLYLQTNKLCQIYKPTCQLHSSDTSIVFIFSKPCLCQSDRMDKLLSAFKWKSKTSVWCRSCKDNEAHLQCAASHDKIFSADFCIGYWPKLSLLTEQFHCCTHKRYLNDFVTRESEKRCTWTL